MPDSVAFRYYNKSLQTVLLKPLLSEVNAAPPAQTIACPVSCWRNLWQHRLKLVNFTCVLHLEQISPLVVHYASGRPSP